MTRTPQSDAQVAHRFRFAADILESMTDGIDGDRLGALVRWALHGEAAADEAEALIRIFEAPHLAAIDEGAWSGDSRAEALADIARVTAAADGLADDAAARVVQWFCAERRRQVDIEGWSLEHDDLYDAGEMAHAAGCYAIAAIRPANDRRMGLGYPPDHWPWEVRWWKPADPLTMLVKAGALLIAEVERLERRGESRAEAEADVARVTAEAEALEVRVSAAARRSRALASLRALQEGAAIAMPSFVGNEAVYDFLCAIHREAVKGQLASDDVANEGTLGAMGGQNHG